MSEYENVEEYFNKKFYFKYYVDWHLPKFKGLVYDTPRWVIPKFQEMKNELNSVKEQLEQFDLLEWSQHTRTTDIASGLFPEMKKMKPELLTQAWCKFYEILSTYEVVCKKLLSYRKFNSVHICEAPGAFVSALNHYLRLNHKNIVWQWMSSSLNPEYEGNNVREMIPDNRLIKHTRQNWFFGEDKTGNIISYHNYVALVKECQKFDEVHLVTADGSIDCMHDPGEQESIVAHLLYCETIAALSILSVGGTYVLKMFTLFEDSSINLLYLLAQCFTYLHLFKPCTSKSGNSEVYVVCLEYQGRHFVSDVWDDLLRHYEDPAPQKSMFSRQDIPSDFIQQIEECSRFFMSKQINTINRNISCFKKLTGAQRTAIRNIQNEISNHYLTKYKLMPIYWSDRLILSRFHAYAAATPSTDEPTVKVASDEILFGDCADDKNVFCEFDVGKQIETVHFTLYCDKALLKILQNTDFSKVNSSSCAHRIMQNIPQTEKYKSVLHIEYDRDNRSYTKKLLSEFYRVLSGLSVGDSVALLGGLYLTRFEIGLLFLMMYSFAVVDYFHQGVVLLKSFSARNSLPHFHLILERILQLDKQDRARFTPSLLSVLPCKRLESPSFSKRVQSYNNSFVKLLSET